MVASGRYHRSVRSVDLARLKDSFPVSFSVAFWGLFIRTFFFFLDLSPSRRRALAQATKPRRRCLAKPPHGCAAASSRLTSRPRLRAPAQPRSAALASPRLRAQLPSPSRAAVPKPAAEPPRLLSISPASSRPSSAGQSLPRLPVFAKCSCPVLPLIGMASFVFQS